MTKTVLIVWEHGGNLGHLSRLLPIALALKAANVKVVFAVADEAAAKRYFGPQEFTFVRMPRVATGQANQSGPSGVLNHADFLLRAGFNATLQAKACVEQWHEVFASVKPEAVLVDASPMALYAGLSAKLKTVVIGHGFEIPPSAPRPCFVPWVEDSQAKSQALETLLQQRFDELKAMLVTSVRANAPTTMKDLYPMDITSLCAWPEFDHFDRTNELSDSTALYTGPIWSEPPGAMDHQWRIDDGPKVLCYLNLRDERYDLVWQALKLQGANVLEISPYGVPKACQAARGWGIEVLEHPVQIGQLIRDADAVIGHGGMGLTSMALHAGKPTLLLPEHMEQAILAYRLGKQNLALATVRHKDETVVQQKVAQLLEDENLKLSCRQFSVKHCDFAPDNAIRRTINKLLIGPG